jgi:excisionase family DNA binding protein
MSNTDTSSPEVKIHGYSVKQAAIALGDRSEQHVRNLIEAGELRALYSKTGRSVYIRPSEIDRYLDSLPSERP